MENVLEVGDVAAVLGVSATRVRGLVAAGQLEPFAVTGRGVKLFRLAAVHVLRRRREDRRRDLARNGALAGTGRR